MHRLRPPLPRKTLIRIGLLLWLCSSVCLAEQKQPVSKGLTRQIDAILARGDLARGFWGVQIEELDSGRVLYSLNADRLFLPASNAKLFVTATALARIGPNYRFRTTIEASALPDKDGVLHGNLYLVGRGDPNLSGRELPYDQKTERPLPPEHLLEELADQVVAKGVKVIEGDIVADDSYFVHERYGRGWTREDLLWRYGAPVTALAINDNVVFLHIRPGAAAGEPAILTVTPASGYYEVENQVVTTAARRGQRRLAIDRQPGSRKIKIWGTIPIGDPGTSRALAIEEPADFCAGLLAEMLAQRGVALYGRTRSHHLDVADLETFGSELALGAEESGNLPGDGTDESAANEVASDPVSEEKTPVILAEYVSPPLGEDIQVINKVSQNLHAEILLRLLGREKGSGGSVAAGLAVVREFLTEAGVQPEEYRLYDASGLSRDDLATPNAMVKLLRYAAAQSWGAEFLDSLPQGGVDGTLAYRFGKLPRGTIVRAKTGSLDHAHALSGYLTTSRDRRLVFSILANHSGLSSHETTMVIDSIVDAVARSR